MNARPERPLHKIVGFLGAVCVLGLFLGWMLERMVSDEVSESELDEVFALDTGASRGEEGPSEWERDVVSRATLGLPPYPGAEPHALAADFLGPNTDIAAAWFTTKDAPDQVLDYYKGQFYDAGVPAVEYRPGPNGGYIAYMVPTNHVVRSVTATRQGQQTVVLVSNGDMESFLEQDPEVPADLPHPPEAEDTVVMRMNQEGATDVNVGASLPGGNLAHWVDYYRNGFEAKGWKVAKVDHPSDDEALLEVVGAHGRGTAFLRRERDAEKVQILVRVTQTR
ncbi:MAG: hypothetical protein IRZ16_13945 [Myxococcaceae bacterium]|nr:hypothetical protein [Myxococcaceae bacterium]